MTEFVDFLVSLAPQGETALLVRQKRVTGTYGDGTLKYVWPAALPMFYDGVGAWYGNTASFILERMSKRISASAGNATHCLVLVLDDVGTKSKVPPLDPTWIMETSKDNFQYGYAFSEQPTVGEFSAAINAIAAAGYTDKGAINAVRNFRLPGSENFKRGGFLSRLVEFTPKRQYTLDEICAALGAAPADADTAKPISIRLADTGTDDVLEWLRARGEVMEEGNGQGWYGVRCPNADKHTDQNSLGRYMPLNRAYKCFHEHCGDWDSARYLAWVEAEGGPKHTPGLRDTVLADALEGALAKLTPSDLFTDDAAAVIADVDRKELGRLEKDKWWSRFAYVTTDDAYFDLDTRKEIPRTTFNALYRHTPCVSIHNGRKVEASVSFDEGREANGAKTLAAITYAAGDPVLVQRGADWFGNRWRDARPALAGLPPRDIKPWTEHCEQLVPIAVEREHCYDLMAYRLQHPEGKINHAVLHGGREGCGKDSMWAPLLWAVCGPQGTNRGIMDNDTISSQWGYQLESEILVINELREPDASQRRAFANKLKPIIATPPEYLPINRKGLHPYMMVNRILVLAFSNDPSPVSLSSQDRRWFCVWSHSPRLAPPDATRLWAWYAAGGFSAVADWLAARDLSAFNPKSAPIETEFRLNLVEHGMSAAESVLVEMMRNRKGEFARGVIGGPFHDLCNKVNADMPPGTKVPQAALFHALQEAGWIDIGWITSAEHTSAKHVYCVPGLGGLTKSELRRMLEARTTVSPVAQALVTAQPRNTPL